MVGTDETFGPGKAKLLGLIAATGSIRSAAVRMGMSYNRAWTLVRHMNGFFREPLVESVRGGKAGGGAALTATGRKVLGLYDRMERSCRQSTRAAGQSLRRLLR